jgi:hypothetical protein
MFCDCERWKARPLIYTRPLIDVVYMSISSSMYSFKSPSVRGKQMWSKQDSDASDGPATLSELFIMYQTTSILSDSARFINIIKDTQLYIR